MVMSWLWTIILATSVFISLLTGRIGELSAGILTGASSGIQLSLSIAGALCLWTGVGKLMEHAGITGLLAKIMQPLLHRFFPSTRRDDKLRQTLSANICANLLGLGNAATPMGIASVLRMKDPNDPGCATDEMCRLIVLNTASIQLIPANVSAIRASLGAAAPFDILPAVWVTSICSAGIGLIAAWLLGKVARHE